MEDPERVLAEVESLMRDFSYDHAQIRIGEALKYPNIDRATRRRIVLRAIEISLYQGTPLIPELMTELKGHLESTIDIEAKAETLLIVSRVEARMGHYQEAIALVKRSLTLYRRLANAKGIVNALNTFATFLRDTGRDKDDFRKATTEALKLARASGDLQGEGRALMNYSMFEKEHGFHNLATNHLELATQLLKEAGDNRLLAVALNNQADLQIMRGDISQGLFLLQQALYQWRTLGSPARVALILSQMSRVSVLKGNLQDSKDFLDAAYCLAIADQSRSPLISYYVLCNKADFERKRGNLDQAFHFAKEAISILEKAEISGNDLGYAWGIATSILLEMGRIPQAEESLTEAEVICSALKFAEGILNNILLRGILELQKGNLGLAQDYLEKARAESEEKKFFEVQMQAELLLADLYLRWHKLEYDKHLQVIAANCLLRASQLAGQTALEPWKLEAQILEAVAHSINLRDEKAVEILRNVEAKARGLGLNLIEEKARNIRKPITTRMRVLSIQAEPDEEEMRRYMEKAQEYIVEAQKTFRSP